MRLFFQAVERTEADLHAARRVRHDVVRLLQRHLGDLRVRLRLQGIEIDERRLEIFIRRFVADVDVLELDARDHGNRHLLQRLVSVDDRAFAVEIDVAKVAVDGGDGAALDDLNLKRRGQRAAHTRLLDAQILHQELRHLRRLHLEERHARIDAGDAADVIGRHVVVADDAHIAHGKERRVDGDGEESARDDEEQEALEDAARTAAAHDMRLARQCAGLGKAEIFLPFLCHRPASFPYLRSFLTSHTLPFPRSSRIAQGTRRPWRVPHRARARSPSCRASS